MKSSSLDITLISPDANGNSGLDYWLRLEQEVPADDTVTTGEIAELVDELYHTEPCKEPEDIAVVDVIPKQEQPTFDDLLAAVKAKWDIAECLRLRTGTYTAKVRVIYSHPNDQKEKYKLQVTVGTIDSIIRTTEERTETINVKEVDGYTLEWPVLQDEGQEWPGKAKWLGSVFSEKTGAIPPPPISGFQNKMSWGIKCTGTIIVTIPTVYDLATVTVQGVIDPVTGLGVSRKSTMYAFYHYQRYELEIEMINADTTADGDTLAEVCGWSGGGDGGGGDGGGDGDGDEDGDIGDGDDGPELGCLAYKPEITTTAFYWKTCCTAPPFGISDCLEYASAKVVKSLDPETMRRLASGNDNDIEFIAVGPGPDGCGRTITKQNINQRNCCDDVEPLKPDPSNPTSIAPNGVVMMSTLDGNTAIDAIWEWTAGGGLRFDGNQTRITGGRAQSVYAPGEFCAGGTIQVDDGCTRLGMSLSNTSPPLPLSIAGDNEHTVAPDGYIVLTAEGGVEPYTWEGSDDLVLISDEHANPATFKASSTFCGTGSVHVSDGCTESAEAQVRSTDGNWEQLFDFDRCHPPGAPMNFVSYSPGGGLTGISGKYMATATFDYGEPFMNLGSCPGSTGMVCPMGTVVVEDNGIQEDNCVFNGGEYSNGCCDIAQTSPPYDHYYYSTAQECTSLFQWVCS